MRVNLAARFRIFFALAVGSMAIPNSYLPLYFASLHFSSLQIGLLSGVENVAIFIAPPLLVTRSYYRGMSIAILSGLSLAFMLPVLEARLFETVFLFWLCSMFFNRAAYVVANERAIRCELEGKFKFSEVRAWGSASFIAVVFLLGQFVQRYGTGGIVLVAILFVLGQILIALSMPDQGGLTAVLPIKTFFRMHVRRWLWILWFSQICLWASHGASYAYLSLYLQYLGWEPTSIAWAWNLCVISEILVFIVFWRLEKIFSLHSILLISFASAILRWIILGATTSPEIILAAQTLHGLSFGAAYIASQKLVSQGVAPEARKMSQAILMALASGGGALAGKLIGAVTAEMLKLEGNFSVLFLESAVISGVGAILWLVGSKDIAAIEKQAAAV